MNNQLTLFVIISLSIINVTFANSKDSCYSIQHEYYYIIHKDSILKLIEFTDNYSRHPKTKKSDFVLREIETLLNDLYNLKSIVRDNKYYITNNINDSVCETDTLKYLIDLESTITRINSIKLKLINKGKLKNKDFKFLSKIMFFKYSNIFKSQYWINGVGNQLHWSFTDVFDTSTYNSNFKIDTLLKKYILRKKYNNPFSFQKSIPKFTIYTQENFKFQFESNFKKYSYYHRDCIQLFYLQYKTITKLLSEGYYFIKIDLYY